jgi:hypothetical protein
MQIDQRRVATISLQPEHKREIYIHPEGRGFRLCLVAKDEVVNILLSSDDMQKLRRAVASVDSGETSREFAFAEKDARKKRSFYTVPTGTSAFAELDALNWNELDWLSFN